MQQKVIAITRSYRLLSIQLQRNGFYDFLSKNLVKLFFSIVLLIAVLFLMNSFLADIDSLVQHSVGQLNSLLVLGMYYISQSLLGFLPTNIFIIWIKSFQHPLIMLFVLSLLSYAGGITAYLIGYYSGRNRVIHNLVDSRKEYITERINKWGGLLVMISAIFPLPFSLVCITSGIIRYPISNFLLWSLARIPKFFALAWIIYLVV